MISPKRIEEASLNAWPALGQILYDGWILRFSKGYTKRANSVNPLWDSKLDIAEKIDYCEKLFAEKNLPMVFRLTPFVVPNYLDAILAARNYNKLDATSVMALDIQNTHFPPMDADSLLDHDLDSWLGSFCQLGGYDVNEHQTHREILSLIPTKCIFSMLYHDGAVVSCGLGVLDADYVGLFDLITAEEHRNQGFGRELITGMLSQARAAGARYAYLQVTQNNQPARHLYQLLGFREYYSYWYRIMG